MVKDSRKDRVKELLDGYILGNLSPAEITEFKNIILEDSQLLEDDKILLYVWQLISQNPDRLEPPPHLKATTLENTANSDEDRDRNSNLSWSSIIANLAIILGTTILAIDNHRLRQNFTVVEKQLTVEQNRPWRGISELIKNHFDSLNAAIDPVDIRSNDPEQLITNFEDKIILPKDSLLQLNSEDFNLFGGSLSQIDTSRGIRFTYQNEQNKTISFYQLIRSKNSFFPSINSGYIYITKLDKYNLVMWSNEGIIYAIVADLPLKQLQQLANNVKNI